jgi:protoporphyrinogen/coproporphyrinogen III oxidase
MRPVIVVGGGISGMGAAWRLHQRGLPVLVLESGVKPGGVVQSAAHPDGFHLDLGPQTLSTRDPGLLEDLAKLGFETERRLLRADPVSGERFVVFRGIPQRLPAGFWDLLSTPLLSFGGRTTLVRAPFRKRPETSGHGVESDESIRAAATRWFGSEVADRMVDPFVSGVFAGDPNQVSAAAVLPDLVEAERAYGTLARAVFAMMRRRRSERGAAPRIPRGIYALPGGLGAWPHAVARVLGKDRVKTGARVLSVESTGSVWRVRWERKMSDGARQVYESEASRVILAVPASEAAALIRDLPQGAAASQALRAIPTAPVAVIHLAWPRAQVAHPARGFGLLAPSGENRAILGSLWPSSIFPGTAPDGHLLTANFVGGATRPERVDLDDDALVSLVAGELGALLGASGSPSLTKVSRWVPGIPQYTFGHHDRIAAVSDFERENAGLALIGNWRGGVSLGACWASGRNAADAVDLAPRGG